MQEDLYDFLSLAKEGTVTQEIELELLKENAPEGIKDKMTFSLAKESCDRQNQLLIQDPFLLSELYPYVIGAEISEELLERLPDQPETILNMVFLAKEAENLSLEESPRKNKNISKPKTKDKNQRVERRILCHYYKLKYYQSNMMRKPKEKPTE